MSCHGSYLSKHPIGNHYFELGENPTNIEEVMQVQNIYPNRKNFKHPLNFHLGENTPCILTMGKMTPESLQWENGP